LSLVLLCRREYVRELPYALIIPGTVLQQSYDMTNIGDIGENKGGFVGGMFERTDIMEKAYYCKCKAKEKEQHLRKCF